ncbi:MAG: hypothetical protein ABI821_18730 [Pseudomonadota bacterium]
MFPASRASIAALLLAVGVSATANDAPSCLSDSVEAHVRQQFATFGPLSVNHEYFGFIYRVGATLDSAVVRGSRCVARSCVVEVARAGALIPAGAIVVGEWHTHPRRGEARLSEEDVLGAYRNRNVGCYSAFYSAPDGAIYSWNPRRGMVTTAMASRVHIGNYPRGREGGGTVARN